VAQFDNLATHSQYRNAYSVVPAHLDATTTVLDWGCGNGHFSYFLDHLGVAPVGYSFDPPPRCMAGKRGFRHVPAADPVQLPFPDRSFDAVVSIGVLEHVHETGGDEHGSLIEIKRILVPGGLFLCFHLPNRLGWIEPVTRLLRVAEHVHRKKYGRGDVGRLVANAGLELVEAGRYNFLPRNRLARLPSVLKQRHTAVRLYNLLDDGLALLLPMLCQNWYFVARRS
jgi:SAM-dependent methyltransferase